MKAVFAGSLLLALGLAGCFTARFTDGTIQCSTNDERLCPSGATCVNGLCYHNPDLAPTDFGTSGLLDGGADLSGAD